ncbi:hypothetical protein KU6B_48900 [Mameliella alba]|uniref:hypothetical protein n=1 Tax=Mameliella alba TaxID=561184 RepID=UPI0013E46571|nr:hypothetical protein [Mameliella alba]BBU58625.1 hypothetical protein KU6B_48900 [Mameliella alba]
MVTINASCANCGAALKAADDTPDDQMIVCAECGTEVGRYGDIRKAMIDKGRSEIEGAVADMIKRFNKR